MPGFVVMIRRPGRRARPIYPINFRVHVDGSRNCDGSTRGATDCYGNSARPQSFLLEADAQWFLRRLRVFTVTKKDEVAPDYFIAPRGARANPLDTPIDQLLVCPPAVTAGVAGTTPRRPRP